MRVRWIVGGLVVGFGLACSGEGGGASSTPGSASFAEEPGENPASVGGAAAVGSAENVVPGAAAGAPAEEGGTSLLSFTAGAAVVRATSTYSRTAQPAYALDGAVNSHWQFDYNELTEQELVIQLAGPARLDRIGLLDPQDLASRPSISVAVGDTADGPWRVVGALTPIANQAVSLAVTPPQTASYVRFLLPARPNAEAEAILVAEAFAYGEFVAAPPTAQVAGLWHGGWFIGGVHLVQEGAKVTGCHSSGLPVTGVVDGRTLHLQYPSPNGTPSRAEIVWTLADPKPFLAQTLGEGEPGGQEFGELSAVDAVDCKPGGDSVMNAVDALQTELEETGKVLVYDLLFDFNRSTLRPSSDATLDRIAAMLQAQPEWRVRIEGHTDNVGGAAYNQKLSEERAASTVRALVQRGVAASRLASAGFGDTRPVASNEAAGGRAANRRVELVKL